MLSITGDSIPSAGEENVPSSSLKTSLVATRGKRDDAPIFLFQTRNSESQSDDDSRFYTTEPKNDKIMKINFINIAFQTGVGGNI